MAITGIDTIEGKQIIAAGAVSAKSAEMAYNDENGNPITGYLTAVPIGTMNESAFGYDANDKISGYNGSAFAGGSDVPEGVMVESGLEYNAVDEISGYNGSAIAQYGAEKQWLVHDDTLVHLSNSAQYALGVNLSAVAQLLGVDETVLWENSTGTYCISGSDTFVLNEPASAFKKLQFTVTDNSYKSYNLSYIDSTITGFDLTSLDTVDANTFAIRKARVSTNDYTNYTIGDFVRVNFANNSTINYAGYYGARITKVIGIGRKA